MSRLLRYSLIGALVLAGVLLFVLMSASSNSRSFERDYPVLLAANGGLAFVLFAVVTGLAIRLFQRVRARHFGARLMARFAIAFALMGVLPGVLVYVVSSQFLLRSIESWFNVKVEGALESGFALGRAVLAAQREELQAKARTMARDLADTPEPEQSAALARLREEAGVDQALIVQADGRVIWASTARKFQLAYFLPATSALHSALATGSYASIEGDELSTEPGRGLRVRVIVPIPGNPFDSVGPPADAGSGASNPIPKPANFTPNFAPDSAKQFSRHFTGHVSRHRRTGRHRSDDMGSIRLDRPRLLQLVQTVPPTIAANAQVLQTGYGDYQERSLARLGLQRIYRLTLTLTLLLAIFAAIAASMLLAGAMTAPLVELAAGTKAVAEGDFRPVREFRGNDELNLLPQSFNAMTRQLGEARNAVETRSRQLEAARAYLERLLANLSAGVIVLDPHFAIITANYGAARILGTSLASHVGRSLHDELPLLAKEISRAFHDQALAAAPRDSWQLQMHVPRVGANIGAEPLALLARGSRLPLEDGMGYVVVFDDITQVISAQRAVAWGEVARRLAHEIKNPLTPIQLAAERMQMKLAPVLPDEHRAVLDRGTTTIVNQVAAMKRMVDEFRDYARLPAARFAPLDLNALVEEIGSMYGAEPAAETKHDGAPSQDADNASESIPRVTLYLHPEVPLVEADAEQLRQVIHNLIGNAVESIAGAADPTRSGRDRPGMVVVRTEVVRSPPPGRSGLDTVRRAVRLSIEDNGPGFPAHILRRAFEPYVTTKPHGTGLGLALVKKIIDEHGGTIEIVNQDRGGAVVTVLLHRLSEPAAANAA